MRDKIYDGGAYARSARQLGNVTAETEQNGAWVGRLGAKGIAMSAKAIVNYSAVLAAGETLNFAGNFQDAVDVNGTGAADYGDAVPSTVIATGPTGGATVSDTFEVDLNLSGAREFIRFQPTVSTSSTGTLAYDVVLVFFGDHHEPASKAIAKL